MKSEGKIKIIDLLEIIFKWRKTIIRNVIIIVVLALIVSFLIPNEFTATTTILPPGSEQQSMFGMLSVFMQGGVSNLGSLSELLPGVATPSDLYAAILKSGRIRNKIIEKYNLRKVFKVKTNTDAGEVLDNITRISVSPEGIIEISVTYRDKYLAANIANSFAEELDFFNKEISITTGKKYRQFVEKRLIETSDSLKKAEDALRKFQEQHRTIALDVEIENAIATIAKLKSEIILREVQKGTAASAGGLSNPYVANIERELRELRRQLSRIEFGTTDTTLKEFGAGFYVPFSKLPEVSLEYARLLRDVKIQEAVFELLTQQYEQAKIMEAKDTPTIQILTPAGPPEKKSFPRRSRIVIITFFVALFANIGIILGIERIRMAQMKGETEIERWFTILHFIKGDFNYLIHWIKKFTKWKK